MLNRKSMLLLLALLAVVLAGCAAGPNTTAHVTTDSQANAAGFLLGLWHGIISPVTFVISLFNHRVNLYEVHNNGGWYNFGFILGVSFTFGGGASTAKR